MSHPRTNRTAATALTLGALGVVFGDIGTSPLYAMQTIFSRDADRVVTPGRVEIYGSASLIFWALVIVVTIKYVGLMMGLDNDGEGGIMALIALLQRTASKGSFRAAAVVGLSAAGIFGAALFFGDSMITPAISVLSAVEGLNVISPSLHSAVLPICAAILVLLFVIQHFGTGLVGRLFGPVMLLWFISIAVFGIGGIAHHPGVIVALSPSWAVRFFARDGLTAFLSLGGVVLAVTGAEALYADMGHFGKWPIRRAWLLVVFPALICNYLGQAAQLIGDRKGIASPFFLLIPHGARVPMVLLATLATVIASQAVISGAFSLGRQAIQLSYLPRLRILHTSAREAGQVYLPLLNWGLLGAVLVLVFGFGSSQKLAAAYGVAVCGTITITLTLFLVVSHRMRRMPVWQLVLIGIPLGIVDLALLTANLEKVPSGGWLPILVAIGVYTVMSTWRRGQAIVSERRQKAEGSLPEFIAKVNARRPPLHRARGTAVFLNRNPDTTPLAMRENVEHNQTLHHAVVILTIETGTAPYVASEEQVEISELGHPTDGVNHVLAHIGYLDRPDVPALLRRAHEVGLERDIDTEDAVYFLSKMEVVATDEREMSRWRKRLFLATASLASDSAEYFNLPRSRTVLLGTQIEM